MRDLSSAIDQLYCVFQPYSQLGTFCTFCYGDEEIRHIQETELRSLNPELSLKLLWETGNHWDNSSVYKHYLPRILEILAPPHLIEDLYPGHLVETLCYHKFHDWPPNEQTAVIEFLIAVSNELKYFDEAEKSNWQVGIQRLQNTAQAAPNNADAQG